MQTIKQTLDNVQHQLAAISDSPLLDAEILLAHVLNVQRSYLYTYPERTLSPEQQIQFNDLIKKRTQGQPIPYLTGHCEFWSLDLIVTPDTLIPRPETELLVELVLAQPNIPALQVADLGTGSGAIALALAKERPQWTIYATDLSAVALKIAKINAERLQINNIIFCQGSWCEALPKSQFDIIVSNPPYVAKDDSFLQPSVLATEPTSALIAEEQGLKDLYHIINEARHYLKPKGYLLLEHGFSQAQAVQRKFLELGYTDVKSVRDFSGLNRVTKGYF